MSIQVLDVKHSVNNIYRSVFIENLHIAWTFGVIFGYGTIQAVSLYKASIPLYTGQDTLAYWSYITNR